jgi:hypothetical protein
MHTKSMEAAKLLSMLLRAPQLLRCGYGVVVVLHICVIVHHSGNPAADLAGGVVIEGDFLYAVKPHFEMNGTAATYQKLDVIAGSGNDPSGSAGQLGPVPFIATIEIDIAVRGDLCRVQRSIDVGAVIAACHESGIKRTGRHNHVRRDGVVVCSQSGIQLCPVAVCGRSSGDRLRSIG